MSARVMVRVIALAGLTGQALAEPVKDDATGLTMQPPAGYEARKAEGDPRYSAVYAVQKAGEVDTGCKIAFQSSQQSGPGADAPLSQEDINAFTQKKEWIELIRATLALRYDVATVEPFLNGGLSGASVVADFKPIEGEKPDDVRSYLVVLDTPKGRTTLVCVGDKAGFEKRRPEFEAIARSVSPPR